MRVRNSAAASVARWRGGGRRRETASDLRACASVQCTRAPHAAARQVSRVGRRGAAAATAAAAPPLCASCPSDYTRECIGQCSTESDSARPRDHSVGVGRALHSSRPPRNCCAPTSRCAPPVGDATAPLPRAARTPRSSHAAQLPADPTRRGDGAIVPAGAQVHSQHVCNSSVSEAPPAAAPPARSIR